MLLAIYFFHSMEFNFVINNALSHNLWIGDHRGVILSDTRYSRANEEQRPQ